MVLERGQTNLLLVKVGSFKPVYFQDFILKNGERVVQSKQKKDRGLFKPDNSLNQLSNDLRPTKSIL